MKIKDFKQLKNLPTINVEEIEIDHQSLIETTFFHDANCKDYCKDSINYMIENKVDFNSTNNTDYQIMEKFIIIYCPCCKTLMHTNGGSGNIDTQTTCYHCSKCHTCIHITIPCNGIQFIFPKE